MTTAIITEPPGNTAVVMEQMTSDLTPLVTTQQSSPVAVESANTSLEPSTPEPDHVITKGFQEVCQVSI